MPFGLPDAYARAMNQQRREKDTFFRTSPYSPLPFQERHHFAGLRYFPPDQVYRVNATLERFPEQLLVEIITSDGQSQRFLRFARLCFVLHGTPSCLTAYRSQHEHGEMTLFVPFRDALAGKETYGAGRYLDIPFHEGNSTLVLDFNAAYQPYCAYSGAYSCPLPPAENTLPCAIRAGEKT